MSIDTAWIVLTIVFTIGAAASLLRWLLHKTDARANLDPRVFLILALVLLGLAIITGSVTVIR